MYDKVLEAGVPNAIVIPSGELVSGLRDSDLLWDDLSDPAKFPKPCAFEL